MSCKRYPIDQVITKLREAEVRISRGETVAQACKAIEVTEQTYYRWRKQYGGLKSDQAKRLKELEKENAHWAIDRLLRRRGRSLPWGSPPLRSGLPHGTHRVLATNTELGTKTGGWSGVSPH